MSFLKWVAFQNMFFFISQLLETVEQSEWFSVRGSQL